jgi:hypothetical protein
LPALARVWQAEGGPAVVASAGDDGTNDVGMETKNETELTYILSGSLFDMQSSKLIKVGVHSGSDSRTVKHNLGFAEPPPVAPILEKIMVKLGEALLDD